MNKKISGIIENSIAEEMGAEAGDSLVSINGKTVADVLDYRFLAAEEYLEVLIEKVDGEQWLLEIEKDADEDLGLEFAGGLMDDAMSCRNKCLFCFIDQLPRGMRQSLYFKDDDSRLSFLQGNYVTLTNMSDEDIDRLIYYHLSPINISVQATDPDVRRFMLNNKNAGGIMDQIRRLSDAGLELNFQIVLCRGINDGAVLDRSIRELAAFIPRAKSLSVVPVGITRYREENSLHRLEPYDAESAAALLDQLDLWQDKLKERHGTAFVHASDEFYLKAKRPLPAYDFYEGFPQLENGVGMLALMENEFTCRLNTLEKVVQSGERLTMVTGAAAHGFISGLCRRLEERAQRLVIDVVAVENDFFGGEVNVSGLLTGGDIITALKARGIELGSRLLIPKNALRAEEKIFLDDITTGDVERALGVRVVSAPQDGGALIDCILFGGGKV